MELEKDKKKLKKKTKCLGRAKKAWENKTKKCSKLSKKDLSKIVDLER